MHFLSLSKHFRFLETLSLFKSWIQSYYVYVFYCKTKIIRKTAYSRAFDFFFFHSATLIDSTISLRSNRSQYDACMQKKVPLQRRFLSIVVTKKPNRILFSGLRNIHSTHMGNYGIKRTTSTHTSNDEKDLVEWLLRSILSRAWVDCALGYEGILDFIFKTESCNPASYGA
jgi:hypothetical protein